MPISWQKGERLFEYAMGLFIASGHISNPVPEFINHTSEQFIYFDNNSDISLSCEQRGLLSLFDNISLLFSANNCFFFSFELCCPKSQRSQRAHDIHEMVYPVVGKKGTICVIQHDMDIALSFMGYGKNCILSDWYPIIDDTYQLISKLDIGDYTINSGYDYFSDFVFNLARSYYFNNKELPSYTLAPINWLSELGYDEVCRGDLEEFINEQLTVDIREYGDDYVDYDDNKTQSYDNTRKIADDLDLMLLDIDDEEPIGDEFALDDEDDDYDSYKDEDFEIEEHDEYEFEDVNPEVFKDPTLLVKLLKKNEEQQNNRKKEKDAKNLVYHTTYKQTENVDIDDKDIISVLNKEGISYIDKREQGGALWIIGDHELDKLMAELKERGFRFSFCEKGSKTTGRQPAWYYS